MPSERALVLGVHKVDALLARDPAVGANAVVGGQVDQFADIAFDLTARPLGIR